MKSTLKRTIAKTVLWKILGIVTLVVAGLMFGVDLLKIGGVTVVYHIVTTLMYVAHERLWDRTTWGKKDFKPTYVSTREEDEDYDCPSSECFELLTDIISLEDDPIKITSIDPDVLGGLSIYFVGNEGSHVWITLHNHGKHSVVFYFEGRSRSDRFLPTDTCYDMIKTFLHSPKTCLNARFIK